MSKNLVIVESPTKGKTIERYLGKDYTVKASGGHVRDLPGSTIAVDVDNDFKPRYVITKGKHKTVNELRKLAKNADNVYLATDPDREGEAIAWHLANLLKIDADSNNRVTFNEITEKTVKEAIANPKPINMDLVDAQQARRILDRLVGYELSPFLWKKVRNHTSAGRVQSSTTKIVVDKEREIQAFIPEEYWHIDLTLHKIEDSLNFTSRYHGELQGSKVKKTAINNADESKALVDDLDKDNFSVHTIKKGERKRKPKAPYITSTLQQDASSKIGFNSSRTMSVAQQLYEGINLGGEGQTSLITYMRTDSVRVSDEALEAVRSYIKTEHGDDYLPSKAIFYANKKNQSQDAHEAIRPTYLKYAPEKIKYSLSSDQLKLYTLIWERFIASQMTDAVIDTVTVDVINNSHVFRSRGDTIKFDGYMRVYNEYLGNASKEEIPELDEGEKLVCENINPQQKFTQPPARYTEASLIKEMEDKGIGRPSTYAPTIRTIVNRRYVEKDGRSLMPTELGTIVTEMLEENFDYIVDSGFTAEMESRLDQVEVGDVEGKQILRDFYPGFHADIVKADEEVKKLEFPDEEVGEKCPECGDGDLLYKMGRNGRFIGCSNYPDCTYTDSITYDTGRKCPLCESKVVSRKSRRNRIFYTCDKKGKDKDCEFISWDLPVDDEKCTTCGSYMLERKRKSGDYTYCSNTDCPTNEKTKSKKKK